MEDGPVPLKQNVDYISSSLYRLKSRLYINLQSFPYSTDKCVHLTLLTFMIRVNQALLLTLYGDRACCIVSLLAAYFAVILV